MDYKNGKIYRLDCLVTGEVYIGSTCQPTVAKRLAMHVSGFKKWKKTGKGFVTSFPIIERDNYKISLIEAIQCNTKDELNAREGFYIRTIDCINKNIIGRTKKEYYQVNKEYFLEINKEYYKINKEFLSKHRKEYYQENREEILEKEKEYRINNIETVAQREKDASKRYRDANKDKISQKSKEKYKQKRQEKLQEKADP